ncbi:MULTISPECIES: HNH endonuclease [Sphingobacterium]|uniref:HNH endonuclease n=1 Tax=Sphingobacterium TaxID=28453 RepID=UPI00257D6965|nr:MULTISPECIES: HNH endonuclease [Sphingobacterium]
MFNIGLALAPPTVRAFFIMEVRELNNYRGHFISENGYCFRVKDRKESIIESYIESGIPRVKLGSRTFSILSLMVQYFIGNVPFGHRLEYKVINKRIPLKTIKFKKYNLDHADDRIIVAYKCDVKSTSHNNRVGYLDCITPEDVLNALKRSNFKCIYCGGVLKSKDWHLDHVHPLSMGGRNKPSNIAGTCSVCNLMKGKFKKDKFLMQSFNIVRENIDLISQISMGKYSTEEITEIINNSK